ncbi:MAG: AraC family transcriptional regulator [Pseudomonadota bacterium]
MSILKPEFEFVDNASESVRYLEHGWPTDLCRWHSHEVYELHLLTSTTGKAFVGEHIGEFKPGSLYLVGPQLPHNWVTDEVGNYEPVPLRDMLVQFSDASMNHLAEGFPEFRAFDDLLQRARGGIEFVDFDLSIAKMHLASIRDARGAERILRFLMLLNAVNAHPNQKRLSEQAVAFPDYAAGGRGIGDVVDHITTHFAEEMSLEEAAAMAHLSPTAFSRRFQKFTGTKFTDFVNKVRVGQACAMLQATDEKVATICFEVGFRNIANFNRQFLRVKAMTPSAYRDLVRAELRPSQRELT